MILFFILVFLFFAIITASIEVEIKELNFNTEKKEYIKRNYEIKIKIKIFKFFPIYISKINEKKLQKSLSSVKIKKKIEKQKTKIFDKKIGKELLEVLKNLKINIKNLNLRIQIGTEDAALTAIIIPIIGTILSVYLSKRIEKNRIKQKFLIIPIYNNQNLINIEFSGIFQIEMIHIINTICILNKKRKGDKNERTSNRRSYDYSYE